MHIRSIHVCRPIVLLAVVGVMGCCAADHGRDRRGSASAPSALIGRVCLPEIGTDDATLYIELELLEESYVVTIRIGTTDAPEAPFLFSSDLEAAIWSREGKRLRILRGPTLGVLPAIGMSGVRTAEAVYEFERSVPPLDLKMLSVTLRGRTTTVPIALEETRR